MSPQKYSPTSEMEDLMSSAPVPPRLTPGELVEGKVISIVKNTILIDINGIHTGIVPGREAQDTLGTAKELTPGDQVKTMVLEEENEEGLTVLSLRRAAQETSWDRFEQAIDSGEIIKVKPQEANKGGLLLDFNGIKAFIPVSQLAPLHYPRVNNADANEILRRLEKLISLTLSVKVIAVEREEGKLILSEKAAYEESRRQALEDLRVGQKIKGHISGIVNFGIFVAFDGLEGLVHISEIAWGHVSNPNDYGKLGDEIEVMLIGIEGEKISLSMKRLTKDPWVEIAKKYKVGDNITSRVTRLTDFGAFVEIEQGINGLIHLSEIAWERVTEPHKHLRVGQEVQTKIINIDLDEHRVGLSIRELLPKPADWKDEEPKKETTSESSSTPTPTKTPTPAKNEEDPAKPLVALGIPARAAVSLADNSLTDPTEIGKKTKEELMEIPGIGEKTAEKILSLCSS